MYSILKTEKRVLSHSKNSTVTCCCFLTDNHILMAFSDCSLELYSLHLGS